jgi:hypothetical protein
MIVEKLGDIADLNKLVEISPWGNDDGLPAGRSESEREFTGPESPGPDARFLLRPHVDRERTGTCEDS